MPSLYDKALWQLDGMQGTERLGGIMRYGYDWLPVNQG
jgi:hypothetical protein